MGEQAVTDANHLPLVLSSLHFFGLARPPTLVEPRFKRAIQAQDHAPAFTGNRLHPIVLHSRWCLGAEINIH